MINNTSVNYEVQICVNDKSIRQIPHDGKIFIEARIGDEYTIKVRNHDSRRILSIFSVDSVNPIDGEVESEAGYVISGKDALNLKGWRTSDDSVNAFKFSKKGKAYSLNNKEAQKANIGVLGIKIFSEKIQTTIKNSHDFWKNIPQKPYSPWDDDWNINPWKYPQYPTYPTLTWCSTFAGETDGRNILRSRSNNPVATNAVFSCSLAPQAEVAQDCFGLGTEFSDKEIIDRVKEVSFEKGGLIAEFQIFYTDRESLLKLGVPIIKETKVSFPSAFPKKYCVKPE